MKLLFLSVLFMSLILTGCAGSKTLQESSIQEIFKNGLDNLEEEKYLQAQSDFTQFVVLAQT